MSELRLAAVELQEKDYGQQALVCVVETERSHRETAWQRFLPGGPLAFLPLRDGRSSIVWSTPSAEAERLLALTDPLFRDALQQAFEHRLGHILACGERVAFPLRRQHARSYVKNRLALVGDAAARQSPLTYCGFGNMLRSFGPAARGIAFASALVWFGAERATGAPYADTLVPLWNSAIRLGVFVIITLLAYLVLGRSPVTRMLLIPQIESYFAWIMPRMTRKRICRAFASLRGKKLQNPWKKHDNIPL